MASDHTPRLPLIDLKQLGRPCCIQSTKSRSLTSCKTPNSKKTNRKIQPTSLVYQDEKENDVCKISTGEKRGPMSDKRTVDDAGLDEYITDVIKQCVRDVEKETEKSSGEEVKGDCNDNSGHDNALVAADTDSITVNVEATEVSSDCENPDIAEFKQAGIDNSKTAKVIERKVTFDTTMLAEEILLADASSDSVCDDSLTDSTKSEEELLAQTPVVEQGNSMGDALKSTFFKIQTPKVDFLEHAALNHKVKKAMHSLSSFVISREIIAPNLEIVWNKGEVVEAKLQCSDVAVSTEETKMLNKSLNTDIFTPEKKVCHSASCSPFIPEQHSVSIQNVADVNSVLCSPIPIACSDASTQKECDTQSSTCSPMRFSNIDTSVQVVVETKSAMCTPIRVPVSDASVQNVTETQCNSCSPMLVPVLDVSIQNETEMQSVTCSPMVPCPSVDKSILVSGPEYTDQSTCTESIGMTDEEVYARPDTQTVSTEMEDMPMVDCGTTMTPLKTSRKQGKRLTADDIRKQHPRVLANELETLRTQNQRLEGQVHALEQDAQKFVSQVQKLVSQEELQIDLQHTRNMLEKERDLYWKDFAEWKAKCEELEEKNQMLKKKHEKEISEIKEHYESNDYHSHFLTSQRLVEELQAELQEYKELLPELQQSRDQMALLKKQYSESFEKMKTVDLKLIDRKKELDIKEADIIKQKSVVEQMAEENRNIADERQEMHEKISQMQEDLQKKDEEVTKLTQSNASMHSQLSTIGTLKRTIDNRESEIDMLEKDLFECREVIYNQIEESKAAEIREKSSTTDLNGLKTENNNLKDCVARLRAKEQEVRETLLCVQEELSGTKEHASRIIKQQGTEITDFSVSIGQLSDHMTSVLAGFKKRAGIEDENTDTDNSQGSIGKTLESDSTSGSKRTSKPSFVSQILSAVKTADSEKSSDQNGPPKKPELVVDDGTILDENVGNALDLSRTEDQSFDPHTSDASNSEKKDSPGFVSRKKLGFSDNSAFAPIKSSQPQASALITNKGHVTIRTGKKSLKTMTIMKTDSVDSQIDTAVGKVEVSSVEVKTAKPDDQQLSSQVRNITEMFQQVVHVAKLIEKALRSSLQDLRSENIDLNCKVSQSEYSGKRARAQLEVTQGELESCRKEMKLKEETIESMSERFERMLDAQSEAEKQNREKEIRLLRSKVQSLEGEIEILTEQLNKLLQRVNGNGEAKAANVDVSAEKEIISLKKKVDKYRFSMQEKEVMMGDERSKVNQKVLKLEANLKKADEDVRQLYELIDRVRNFLILSKKFTEDPDLQKVIRVLDGLDSDDGHTLKPVKTSRW